MVLLRLKINLRHIQEVNVSSHTRVVISNKRMNEENISIYEVGTKGRINWTEVCNSKRESSHVRLSKLRPLVHFSRKLLLLFIYLSELEPLISETPLVGPLGRVPTAILLLITGTKTIVDLISMIAHTVQY